MLSPDSRTPQEHQGSVLSINFKQNMLTGTATLYLFNHPNYHPNVHPQAYLGFPPCQGI